MFHLYSTQVDYFHTPRSTITLNPVENFSFENKGFLFNQPTGLVLKKQYFKGGDLNYVTGTQSSVALKPFYIVDLQQSHPKVKN